LQERRKKRIFTPVSTDNLGNPEYFAGLLTTWSRSLFVRHSAAANPDTNAGGGPAQWKPEKTWVFAVGVLSYPSGQAWPEDGRRDADMISQLQARGVPADQITFIKDENATLAAVRASFDAFMAKAPADAILWLYFAGHGTKRKSGVSEFALYDEPWPIPDVFSTIERRFPGNTALLFADCCYSGSLGTEATLRAGRVSYGAITSSLASTVSTGAWTFTECLIAGLRGAIPLSADGDGLITFAELARFAEREMAFNDGQLSTFVATNGFDPGLVLASGIRRAHPLIGEYVEAKWNDGKWYPGRIEKVDGSTFWIRWAGYKESENEGIQDTNIRPFVPTQHAPGTRLDVEWQGSWYPAEVLTGRWGMHLVHYDDFEPVWDEWVSSSRIRLK
jgi:RNA binding activity-knot of a chromodomain